MSREHPIEHPAGTAPRREGERGTPSGETRLPAGVATRSGEVSERSARLWLLERAGGAATGLRTALRAHGSALAALATLAIPGDGPSPDTVAPLDATVLMPGGVGWPGRLDELRDPPGLLFVRGRWPIEGPALAIVGSRQADDYGRAVTAALAGAAARAGWVVISGGARGVDGIAHRAALAAGGRTMVVLGSGFRRPYPAEHRTLFQEVAARGALISEYPPCRAPRPSQFPERNRLVAGLADAVLVTQAARRSGALATARSARALGRPVLAVPADVTYGLGAGVGGLLATGASAVVGPRHLRSVLQALARGVTPADAGWPRDPLPRAARSGADVPVWPAADRVAAGEDADGARSGAGSEHGWLLRHLRVGHATRVDDLIARSGRSPGDVLQALVRLELDADVERAAGGSVRRLR